MFGAWSISVDDRLRRIVLLHFLGNILREPIRPNVLARRWTAATENAVF
jgi:hypothetical protein